MPSDPPADPQRDQARPAGTSRSAPGGSPGSRNARRRLGLLRISGLALGLIPALLFGLTFGSAFGQPHPALAATWPGTPPLASSTAPATGAPAQELLAAAPANLPPFYVEDADGRSSGFAVELLRIVAARAGYSLRLIPTASVDEAEHLLRRGRVQVMPGLGVSPARAQAMGFTQPFETLPVHIFFRAGAPPLADLSSLAGKRLALVAGSIPVERLAQRAELNILLTQTLAEAIFDVLAGQADALVYLAPVVQQAARSAGVEHKLGQSARPLFEISRALAVAADQPQLLKRLDTALGAVLDTQEFRDLYSKWHPAPQPVHVSPRALWTMAAVVAALAAALLAWRSVSLLRLNRKLRLAVSGRDQALAAQRLTEERLEALFTLAHMDTASTDELVDFALEQGVRLTGSQNGYLIFIEGEEADCGRAVWSKTAKEHCALLPEMYKNAAFTISLGGLWCECLRTGVPSIINDYPAHPGRRPLPEGHAPITRHMGVPLLEEGRALVMFGVGNKPEPYDDTDARQLQLFLSGLWRVLKARRDADAIRQAKDYAESLLEGANAMIVGLDRAGRVTTFNAAAEAITGYAQREMLGRDWFGTLYPGLRGQGLALHYSRVMAGQISLPRQGLAPLGTRDGKPRLISWQNSLLCQGGETIGIIAFGIDITERRMAEEALQAQNREIRILFDSVPALIFYKSLDNRILRANAAWFRTLGLGESSLGVPLEQIFPRQLAAKLHHDDLEVLATGKAKMNILENVHTPQGSRRFITHKLPRRDETGAVSGITCIATDVTEHHLAKEALAQSEEKFRTLAEDSPALICRFLPNGGISYVNQAYCAAFGKTVEELLGKSFLDLVPAEDRQGILAHLRAFTPENPVTTYEHQVTLPDGRIGWQSWTDRALFDQAGNLTAFQSVGVDITGRKQAEIDLKRLHRAIEQAAEGVLITDKDGTITYINPALERMTGLSSSEARENGLSVQEIRRAVLQHQESAVHMDEGGNVWRGTSSFARPHGQNVEVEFTISAIHDTEGELISFVAVCRDVTEKRLLERQLWQAQKMEALGTLAGGIAHDFNNILASIMGFTELALDDTPPTGRARSSLMRVLKASSRAKELVRQILTFSRRADRERRTLQADQVIGEALRLMEASLPKDITIAAQLQAHDCAILADPSQIHQIVMNLCTNAAQAMKAGGCMGVRTQAARLGEDISGHARRLPAGQYLSLIVEDTGHGIPPDVLGRIFDPFFTTKDSGEGTGLGLAVVHGIVSSLGGTVFAESEPGFGARLTVLLPTAPANPSPPTEPLPSNPKGRERILLVDDETELLDLVRQTLEPLGYQVAAHNLPEAALTEFLASPQAFDLVLTDQSMPRLSGLQLAARLREVRPDLPIVLCTGLSMVIPPDRLQALGEAWLLSKPFSTSELAQIVRQALASTRGGNDAA